MQRKWEGIPAEAPASQRPGNMDELGLFGK